ncbi:MAG: lysine transporter LysE [Deltaproteobacteria bacterium GWA2_57_13]|jgi:threonine/homoserine/homoserine lactone efflux protein|nr:MAG: lysine transporter LysE [Deltaproteobacteria bacterium GWA2_57_13]OGQ74904.1 MAG: lysine transporter LysE [Deltaproteobacteria bacterium RIFCSPLOWO2_12_FULL_57_22]
MQLGLFLKGILIGFVVAVPIGPMGVLCVSRALSGGPVYGLFSGLGVATGDAVWAGIAALGLTMISGFLLSQQSWLRLIGGIFLCYLGIKTFLTGPRVQTVSGVASGLGGAYGSTFFLTFSNPATILSFVAIYAGWGVESLSGHYVSAAVLTAGVFVGSASWWILLSGGLLAFRKSFAYSGLQWVERISGAIIAGLGLFIILLSLI